MRVVTLNTWGGRIYEPLMQFLQSIDADIYCLQEIFDSSSEGFYSDEVKGFRSGDPLIRANLFSEIQKILPNHRGVMHPACRWEIQEPQELKNLPCYFGIATFVRESLPLHGVQSKFVFEEFRMLPQTTLPTPRIAFALRTTHPVSRRPYVIAHMHGLWIREGKHDTPARIEQAKELLRLIESVAQVGDSVVVGGDFNVLPGSETFSILQGLKDLVTHFEHQSTRTPLYYNSSGKKDLPRHADYMLVSRSVKVKKFEVVHEPVISDHCALVLDFE